MKYPSFCREADVYGLGSGFVGMGANMGPRELPDFRAGVLGFRA